MFARRTDLTIVGVACTAWLVLAAIRFSGAASKPATRAPEQLTDLDDSFEPTVGPALSPDPASHDARGNVVLPVASGGQARPTSGSTPSHAGAVAKAARPEAHAALPECRDVEVLFVDVDARGAASAAWLATAGGTPQKVAPGGRFGRATLVSAVSEQGERASSVILDLGGERCRTVKPIDRLPSDTPRARAPLKVDHVSTGGAPRHVQLEDVPLLRRLREWNGTVDRGGVGQK
jgi:hypothetical protein